MKRKWLAIGIILVFVGTNVVVAGNSVQKKNNVMQDTPVIEHIPDDGLYWNDRNIAEYPVIFYLHYYFKRNAHFCPEFIVSGNPYRVDYYINELLQATIFGGPYYYSFNITVTPFHHSLTFGIKVYFIDEEILWDNVTIYRLFP